MSGEKFMEMNDTLCVSILKETTYYKFKFIRNSFYLQVKIMSLKSADFKRW